MATTTGILALKQPSERLKQAINNCSLGFRKLADSIQETLRIGESEGFSPKEIGVMIRQEMTSNGFSLRTVQRYLPAKVKRSGGYSKEIQPRNDKMSFQSDRLDIDTAARLTHEDLVKMNKMQLIQVVETLQQLRPANSSKPKQKTVTPVTTTNTTRRSAEDISSNTPEVLRLSQAGKSQREISRITGVSKTSVVRILTKNK